MRGGLLVAALVVVSCASACTRGGAPPGPAVSVGTASVAASAAASPAASAAASPAVAASTRVVFRGAVGEGAGAGGSAEAARGSPGSAVVPDRGLDAEGRFHCRERLEIVPPEDSADCPMATGPELQLDLAFRATRGAAVERFRIAEPQVWQRTDCGAGRRAIRRPDAALVARLVPGYATIAPAAAWPTELASSPCADPRLALDVVAADVAHVPSEGALIHRITPRAGSGDVARVRLLHGDRELLAWRLPHLARESRCESDAPELLPTHLDLVLVCRGSIAVLEALEWRDDPESSCDARARPSAPATPERLRCSLTAPTVRAWQPIRAARSWIDLDGGAMEPIGP